ncbi:hypothetical protein ACFST9_13965 [Hymenobacter monticola]|uniref:Uncharacterized protein n=2 Tax=Hymenobacter TaxID=89966 RepID=A0ABY4BE53_9BACT|nr:MULTISPECIES: hypothetical protein [Hymenobacter]MDU0372294.1 hypothetical protein [Hymenobacter endophyticus]UOE36572.1 hypothetical protein MTP16_24660 [Hymenobacter monticola]
MSRLKPVPIGRRQPVDHNGQSLGLTGAQHPDVGAAAADLVADTQQLFHRLRQPAYIGRVGVGLHVPAQVLQAALFRRIDWFYLNSQVGLLGWEEA